MLSSLTETVSLNKTFITFSLTFMFNPDVSYRTKKGIVISAICFKKLISYKTLLFIIFLTF